MEKVITKIELQKRNKDRVNIFVDGEFSFSCSAELVYTHALKQNKAIDIDKLKSVVFQDSYMKCKNSALKIIERSYKTKHEMYNKLILKGYDDMTIAKTIEFLQSYNMLNDETFCSMYIKDKIKVQGKSKIKSELLHKGVDKELVEEKIMEIDTTCEYNAAYRLAEKKYVILQKTERDYRKISRKLWDLLMRSGYSSNTTEDIIQKLVVKEDETVNKENSTSFEDILCIAKKRFNIIIKSESDERKIYKKLSDFLHRRGYSYEDIKKVLKELPESL